MKILKLISGMVSAVLLLEILMRLASPIIGPPQTVWQIQQQAKLIKIQERPSALGPIDMVIMGDSTGKEGVDPDVLDAAVGGGFHSFNASLNSSTTYTIMKQFKDILRYSKPKYLLIMMAPNISRESDVDVSAETYDVAASAHQGTGVKSFLNRNFYLYRYRNNVRDPFILNTLYRSIRFRSLREGVVYRNVDTMKFNGDSSFARTLNSYATGRWQLPATESLEIPSQFPSATLRHLRIMKAECQKIGAKLILATVPTNSYDPTYRALIPAMAKDLGVGFIQGNDATTNLAHFSDGVHLNEVGAKKLSRFVGDKIRNII
ncbi:MAG TPA: hypothetical protein VMW30_09225 [Candidatus Paceibacterota bacterium]|nr:hypothetical protein [Candidatus Paceibacterota bacterium]